MNTAIYARKSTDQSGVVDEQKSVARQIEHARAYAVRKGWIVDESCVFVDDGISGAEFANRPGFLRLMNTLKPRPPFQVLGLIRFDGQVNYAVSSVLRSSL
jgi:site-specific DNA recombinase